MIIALLSAAWAACVYPAYISEVEETLDKAEKEYPAMDAGDFVDVSAKLTNQIECLEEVVTPEIAARVHRIMGLRARVAERNADAARMAFSAARRLDASYVFPESVVGPRDPENIDYMAVPTSAVVTEDVRKPVSGNIRFDGKTGRNRPVNAPTVYQRFDPGGQVADSSYLWPGDRMPFYQAVPEGTLELQEVIFDKILPAVTAGGSAGTIGAGLVMLSVGSWDKKNICKGDSACIQQAKERMGTGYVLTAAGVGGFVATGVILFVDGKSAHLGISRRW